ncbi:Alpha/beta hydrolase fold-1 [Trinorchestia longiramus]|nr:Alpha/beta hydrolase fold-1 [Trinorchestia longiramus]
MDSLNFAPPLRPKLPTGGNRATAHRGSIGSGGRRTLADVDSSPVSWRQYWNSCDDVKIESTDGEGVDQFRVYRRGTEGPLLVLLHGGGYSALTWSLVVEEICNEVPQCQVLAFDQRGHGSTKTVDPSNMAASSLARDVGRVLDAVMGPAMKVPVVLVGHSMGGAVAVHAEFEQHLSVQVAGLVVIDVVEGTAVAALSSMHSVLAARPASFASLQEAVLWSYRSGQTRNLDAARVSMPGQVRNSNTGLCGADEVEALQHRKNSETLSCASDSDEKQTATEAATASSAPSVAVDDVAPLTTTVRYSARRLSCRRLSIDNENKIEEEEEDADNKKDDKDDDADRRKKALHNEEFRKSFESKRLKSVCGASTSSGGGVEGGCYKWSINLASTTEHWNSWFEGLSQSFLSVAPPKLLLLAGVDRLDTDLTVGQMQGKFQMQVVGRCGHAVHEDAPEDVAAAIIAFLTRHRVLQPKNPQRFRALPGC